MDEYGDCTVELELELGGRGEVKVDGLTSYDPGTTGSVVFIDSDGIKCSELVGEFVVGEGGRVDAEFDATWIVRCELVNTGDPVNPLGEPLNPIVGSFKVEINNTIFVPGYCLDEDLAIDDPEDAGPPEGVGPEVDAGPPEGVGPEVDPGPPEGVGLE